MHWWQKKLIEEYHTAPKIYEDSVGEFSYNGVKVFSEHDDSGLLQGMVIIICKNLGGLSVANFKDGKVEKFRFHTSLDNKHFYYKYKYRKPKQNIYWNSGYDNGLEMKGPYFFSLKQKIWLMIRGYEAVKFDMGFHRQGYDRNEKYHIPKKAKFLRKIPLSLWIVNMISVFILVAGLGGFLFSINMLAPWYSMFDLPYLMIYFSIAWLLLSLISIGLTLKKKIGPFLDRFTSTGASVLQDITIFPIFTLGIALYWMRLIESESLVYFIILICVVVVLKDPD